jgi:hypothetical protein
MSMVASIDVLYDPSTIMYDMFVGNLMDDVYHVKKDSSGGDLVIPMDF